MVGAFLLKNIEIIAGLAAIGSMGVYMCFKKPKPEDMDNDLTSIIIENKKLHKSITDKLDNGLFNIGNK